MLYTYRPKRLTASAAAAACLITNSSPPHPQVSLMHGIQLLRLLQFDRQIICERRQRSELTGSDVLVWTNGRFVHWARSIDLAEYADNLKGERNGSGVRAPT